MIERVEMVDGRVYSTVDGWETVFVSRRGGRKHRVTSKQEADLARFLAMMQQEGGT